MATVLQMRWNHLKRVEDGFYQKFLPSLDIFVNKKEKERCAKTGMVSRQSKLKYAKMFTVC